MTLAAPLSMVRGAGSWLAPGTGKGAPGGAGVRVTVPAAASLGVGDVLAGSMRPARILGASRQATWLGVGDRVLVVGGPGAVRLPNGISMRRDPELAGGVSVGGGCVVAADETVIRVRRWWDPRPVLPRTDRGALDAGARTAALGLDRRGDAGLGEALQARDPSGVVVAARRLLGRGRGLTPEGDDLLAATLASFVLLGTSLGDESPRATVRAVEDRLATEAATRTTALSCALLRHALAGEVAEPVAALLRALAGRGDIVAAVGRLMKVGHSSGPALTDGTLVGAAAATGAGP